MPSSSKTQGTLNSDEHGFLVQNCVFVVGSTKFNFLVRNPRLFAGGCIPAEMNFGNSGKGAKLRKEITKYRTEFTFIQQKLFYADIHFAILSALWQPWSLFWPNTSCIFLYAFLQFCVCVVICNKADLSCWYVAPKASPIFLH